MPNDAKTSNEFRSRAAGAVRTDLDLNHYGIRLQFGIWHSDLGAQSEFAQHQRIGFSRAPSV
jgi:hypothetical protein